MSNAKGGEGVLAKKNSWVRQKGILQDEGGRWGRQKVNLYEEGVGGSDKKFFLGTAIFFL